MTKDEEQKILLAIVETWRLSEYPEYRGFRCANCQQYRNQAWYHWLNSGDEYGNFRVPIHMCGELCEPQFKAGTIVVKGQALPQKVDRSTFGHEYKYSEKAIKRFGEIINSWPEYKEPELKAYTCDECGKDLDIDPADGQRKAYHVWWKADDGKTLAELHFHKNCGNELEIYG